MDKILKEKYDQILSDLIKDWSLDDKIDLVYYKLFNEPCRKWGILINNNNEYVYVDPIGDSSLEFNKYIFIAYNEYIDWCKKNCDYFRDFQSSDGDFGTLYIVGTTLMFLYKKSAYVKEIVVYDYKQPYWIKAVLHPAKEQQDNDSSFTYIVKESMGDFTSMKLTVKHNQNISLDNYNDDLPYDKMKEFCTANNPGLMIFCGKAGTGKTSLIKKLIYDCDTQFILLSADTLLNIDSSQFMNYLIRKGSNAVLVLEDCDALLKSRDLANNSNIVSVLLNLSDGILGDALNLKFICTYNTDDSNVDSALLRKGRLKLKYEFKPLTKEKVHKLDSNLNTSMTLAEFYNKEDNDYSAKNKKSIGF